MDSQRAAALSEGSCVLAKPYRGRADRHQSMGDPDYPGIQARDRPRQVPRTGAQSCNARCGRRRLRRSCRLLRAAGARTDSDRDHNKTNGNSGSEHGLDCPSHAPRQIRTPTVRKGLRSEPIGSYGAPTDPRGLISLLVGDRCKNTAHRKAATDQAPTRRESTPSVQSPRRPIGPRRRMRWVM
jgi:hypothetical protein